jgi:hypothetical protein
VVAEVVVVTVLPYLELAELAVVVLATVLSLLEITELLVLLTPVVVVEVAVVLMLLVEQAALVRWYYQCTLALILEM